MVGYGSEIQASETFQKITNASGIKHDIHEERRLHERRRSDQL